MQKILAIHGFVLAICFCGLSAFGAPVPAALGGVGSAPPKLAQLDSLFAYYRSLSDFKANFRQTKILVSEGLTLVSTGTLAVSLGKALLWEITTPAHLGVYMDGKILRIRSGGGSGSGPTLGPKPTTTTYDLQSSTYSEKIAEHMRELSALLAMQRDVLEASYTVTASPAKAAPRMILTPKTMRQFKQVQLELVNGQWIKQMAIEEVSGDRMVLEFSQPQKADTQWIATWKQDGDG